MYYCELNGITFVVYDNRRLEWVAKTYDDGDLFLARQVETARRKICPHQVTLEWSSYYTKREYLEKWIQENTSGVWCHILQTCYKFSKEEDAVAFKLRWIG